MLSPESLQKLNSSGWIVDGAFQHLDHTWSIAIKRWEKPGLFTKYYCGQTFEEALNRALLAGQELLTLRATVDRSAKQQTRQLTLEDLDL